jgi:cell division protease FtsH
MIDEEVRILVASCYERTKALLISNKPMVFAVANLLLEKETLYKEDLEKILGKRNPPKKTAPYVESTVR